MPETKTAHPGNHPSRGLWTSFPLQLETNFRTEKGSDKMNKFLKIVLGLIAASRFQPAE